MFIPVHTFTYYKKLLKLKNNAYPEAMKFFASEVSLPMSPKADLALMEKAAETIALLLKAVAK
jgi:dTDP-4-amino-4,6-dideoxygalactose transaminase